MSTERETSIIEIKDKEIQEYQWDFKIPPKSRIQQNINAICNGGFCFNELRFKKGILGATEHSWGFAIYSNQVNAYLSIPRRSSQLKLILHPSKLELISKGEIKAEHVLRFQSDELSSTPSSSVLWSSCWNNGDLSWDDSIDLMRVTLYIECETAGRCIRSVKTPDWKRKTYCSVREGSALELDGTDFFLSKDLSDAVFVCNGEEFPTHRFLLSCKSPVFNRMFQNGMKEAEEGRIVIEDMEPQVLKELLRFLYCGKVEKLGEYSADLFIAADKYNINALKIMCEIVLVCHVTSKNALDMYILGETHGGFGLMERSVDVLKRNKSEVVRDSTTFRDFAVKYPELMFELYKL